jgi:2-keto-3-deoxy-L-rhamnonate aldolase RhmA
MRTNFVKKKLLNGEPTLGVFMGMESTTVAELLVHAGYDWIVVETEHNGVDWADVKQILMAMSSGEAIPIIRVPSSKQVHIQRALDLGGMGVLVPMVRTAEEVENIVRATRYPPQGTRSWGGLRPTKYTTDNKSYMDNANDNMLVSLIVETKEAIDNIEEIAAVPGLDVLFLGMWDLCLSHGLNPIDMPFAETDAIVERVRRVGREAGVAVGTGFSDQDHLRKCISDGYTWIASLPDYSMLVRAAQANVTAFREETNG